MKPTLTQIIAGTMLVAAIGCHGPAKQTPPPVQPVAEKRQVDQNSPFAQEARSYGLDPNTTTGLQLKCAQLGLPLDATVGQMIEREYGFNPDSLPSDVVMGKVRELGYGSVQDLYDRVYGIDGPRDYR